MSLIMFSLIMIIVGLAFGILTTIAQIFTGAVKGKLKKLQEMEQSNK